VFGSLLGAPNNAGRRAGGIEAGMGEVTINVSKAPYLDTSTEIHNTLHEQHGSLDGPGYWILRRVSMQ